MPGSGLGGGALVRAGVCPLAGAAPLDRQPMDAAKLVAGREAAVGQPGERQDRAVNLEPGQLAAARRVPEPDAVVAGAAGEPAVGQHREGSDPIRVAVEPGQLAAGRRQDGAGFQERAIGNTTKQRLDERRALLRPHQTAMKLWQPLTRVARDDASRQPQRAADEGLERLSRLSEAVVVSNDLGDPAKRRDLAIDPCRIGQEPVQGRAISRLGQVLGAMQQVIAPKRRPIAQRRCPARRPASR
jgi:hypothetical protein